MSELKLSGASIVLRGSFNPPIFQPSWLAAQGLLSDQEAESAKIEIIHQDIVLFATEAFSTQVTAESFQIETTQAPSYSALRDLGDC